MQQAQWEEAMNEISLELSYGAVKETITFACEPVTTYSKNEENISAVLYYGCDSGRVKETFMDKYILAIDQERPAPERSSSIRKAI